MSLHQLSSQRSAGSRFTGLRTWQAFVFALALCVPVFATGGNGGISILPVQNTEAATIATHHISDCWHAGVLVNLPGQDAVATTAIMLPGMITPASMITSRSSVRLTGAELKALWDQGVSTLSLHVVTGESVFVVTLQMATDGSCEVRIR